MSTKKDKFSIKDKFYMDLALDLARSREGLTGTNPSVGCIIVKHDKIISVGQTSFKGRPHEIILSCFTITQPTDGLVPVSPSLDLAKSKARSI